MLSANPLTDAAGVQFGSALTGFGGGSPLDLSGLSGGSTTSMNVTYAPVINIQGTGNQQDINQAIKDGNDDFIKKLKASQEQNRRLSYV